MMRSFGSGGGLIYLLTLILFVWALVDILRANREGMWKLLWVIICLIVPLLGPIVYYFLGRRNAPPHNLNTPKL